MFSSVCLKFLKLGSCFCQTGLKPTNRVKESKLSISLLAPSLTLITNKATGHKGYFTGVATDVRIKAKLLKCQRFKASVWFRF